MASTDRGSRWIDLALLLRGIWFLGRRHRCPICGWSFRTFVHGGGSFRPRTAGYCPRCNSKSRHRLLWLYLQDNMDLLDGTSRLLHVSPHYSLGRRLSSDAGPRYFGVDLEVGPHVVVRADLSALPFVDDSFDAAICVHVLEHVRDDALAIAELYRTTRPGGWALVNVPVADNPRTLEDAAIATPSQRREAFGEETHVRLYGRDLVQRLASPGFRVEPVVHRTFSSTDEVRFGLPNDEQSFMCTKPAVEIA